MSRSLTARGRVALLNPACRRQRQTSGDGLRLYGGEDDPLRILKDMPLRILGYFGRRHFDPALRQEPKPIQDRVRFRGALSTAGQKCSGLLLMEISVPRRIRQIVEQLP